MWAIAVLAGSPGWNLLSQCSRCSQAGQARGFGVVACGVGGDEVVDGVVGVAGPGQEVVDGAAGAEVAGAVEAVVALCFGERPADALQADPLGAEQELIAAARCRPGRCCGRRPWRPIWPGRAAE